MIGGDWAKKPLAGAPGATATTTAGSATTVAGTTTTLAAG